MSPVGEPAIHRRMSILQSAAQVLAFLFPAPVNAWLHKLGGAKIDGPVSIDPGVLILARNVEIGKGARIKFGTMISVRTFRLGKKSKIGFFTHVKGESDLLVGDACIIGPKCMINCSREVVLDRYSGVGPGSYLYTHGSGMPVTEGYRATFSPIRLEEKVWVSMRCVIGPGVTVGEGTNVMPGTVLVESVPARRLVAGNPVKLSVVPRLQRPMPPEAIPEFAHRVLEEYCGWSNEYEGTSLKVEDGKLVVGNGSRRVTVCVDGDGDIALLTKRGDTRQGMYFNLADLSTDDRRHPAKRDLEAYLRMYYGLIFL